MGPGHPVFAGRGGGGAGGGPPGPPAGLPPGARWDPVAPEGLPGFRPEDFQRPPPGRFGEPHPDVEFMPGRDPGGPGFGPGGPNFGPGGPGFGPGGFGGARGPFG